MGLLFMIYKFCTKICIKKLSINKLNYSIKLFISTLKQIIKINWIKNDIKIKVNYFKGLYKMFVILKAFINNIKTKKININYL